jgi:hypothetical protein
MMYGVTSVRTDGVYFVISNLARGPSRVAQGGCVLALVYNALKGIFVTDDHIRCHSTTATT